MALQAVNKDLVHRRCRGKDMINAQGFHNAANVLLGLIRDVAVVESEGQHPQTHVDQAAQHIGAVFASAEQGEAVIFAASL